MFLNCCCFVKLDLYNLVNSFDLLYIGLIGYIGYIGPWKVHYIKFINYIDKTRKWSELNDLCVDCKT